jgi:Zn-dependent M28 family amino/carboxypeptidase
MRCPSRSSTVGAVFTCAAVFFVHALRATSPNNAGEHWWGFVKYLADDQLQGRNTGSEGHRKAAEYLAHRFAADGLKPAGTQGYIQPVPFIAIRVDQDSSKAALIKNGQVTPLASGEEVLFSSRADWQNRVEAPLVFAGYALSAPSAGYNDLAGLDLKGKIAVYLSGAGPSSVPGNLRAHFGSSEERWKALKAAGAVGVAAIQNPRAMDIPWQRIRNNASQAGMILADPALQDSAGERVGLIINPTKADVLFTGSGHTFEETLTTGQQGKPLAHFPLAYSLRVEPVVVRSKVESQNVAGVVTGTDPELKNQYVVLTAHLDHLGVGKPINGDAIFNGAMDDASGDASLLEIAHELKETSKRPRRSLLFLAVTGEEKGLLGSRYFTAHPTVPTASMIADINIDMFLPIHPLHILTVFGLNESSLGDTVRAVAAEHHVEVQDDPQPERNIFIRSDQYNFIIHGIPAVMCAVGSKPGSNEAQIEKRWLTTRYHAPSDDVNQPVDLDAAALYNELMLDTAMKIADSPQRATWKPTSFFKTFAE